MKTKKRKMNILCLLAAFFALTAILACTPAAYAVDQNPHNVVIGREIELKHGKIGILWTRGGGTEDVEWFTPEDVPVQGVTRQCHVDDWIYVMFRAENGYVIKGKYIYAYSEELDGGRRLLNDDWGDRYEGDIVVPSDIEDFDFYITIDAAFKPETGKREIVVGSREPLSHGKVIIKSNTGTPLAEFTQKGDCLANEGASYRVSFIADEGYELDEKEIVFYSFDDGEDTEADLIYDSETDCYTFTVPTDRTDDYEIAINASFRKIPTHSVTVHGGTADKASAAEGESVTITADEPEEGMRFKEWTGADGLTFTSGGPTDAEATFTMPAQAVAVTATYEPAAPEFTTHQLILSGQIGMHFYMSIPEGMTGGTMTFTVGTGDSSRTATAAGTLQSDGRYKFTCYVNSVEMAEPITATYSYVADSATKTATDTTSVKEYLEVIIKNENGLQEYEAATPLAKAIYNYGYYAMQAVPGGSKHPMMPDTYTGEEALITALEGYAISATLGSDVTKASYSLDLDSETAINFYLTTETELTKDNVNVTAAAGTTFEYTVEKVGSRYRVQITEIGAHELGTVFTMTTGDTTISASAMTYVQQSLANSSASEATKNAAAALYKYYQQAINYGN